MSHQALTQAERTSHCLNQAPPLKRTKYCYDPGLQSPDYMTHLVHLLKEKDEKFIKPNIQLQERFLDLSNEINHLYDKITLTSHEMFQIPGMTEYFEKNLYDVRLNREQLWSKLNILPQEIQDIIRAKVEDDQIISFLNKHKEHVYFIQENTPRFPIDLHDLPLYTSLIDAGLICELRIWREPPFFYNPIKLISLPAIVKTAIFLSPITLGNLQFTITATLHERSGIDYFPSLQIWAMTTIDSLHSPQHPWFHKESYDLRMDRFQSTIWFYKKLEYLLEDYSFFMTDGLRIVCTNFHMGKSSYTKAAQEVIKRWMNSPPLGPETKEAFDIFIAAKRHQENESHFSNDLVTDSVKEEATQDDTFMDYADK